MSGREPADPPGGDEPGAGARRAGDCPPDFSDNRRRPRYFRGQLLTDDDFRREQEYHRAALRRHNRVLHGWGVASGFGVTLSTDGHELVVHPGYALDPCGRELVLTEPMTVPVPAPADDEHHVVARAVEVRLGDGIVRDDVEAAVVSSPSPSCVVLASVRFRGERPVIHVDARRPLSRDAETERSV